MSNMDKNGYIGVIDSGLGEISVLLKLIKYFPNGKFVCFADTKNNPYGTKDKKTIINLTENIIKKLIGSNINNIIIACNTMSTASIEYLNNKYKNINFFGTFPVFNEALLDKPIIKHKESFITFDTKEKSLLKMIKINKKEYEKRVLVLATSSTIKSNFLKKEIRAAKNLIKVYKKPADKIVQFVENDEINTLSCYKYIKDLLKDYMDIDYIVLACTHFPFIINIIKKIYDKKNITIIDNTEYVAKNFYTFYENNIINYNNDKLEINILDTKLTENRKEIYYNLLKDYKDSINFITNL